MRQIARNMGISDRSVKRISKPERGLKPYKLRKVQLLTEKKQTRAAPKMPKLLTRVASQRWEKLLFTDDKLFKIQQVHSSQNDRIWCLDVPITSAIVEHRQYLKKQHDLLSLTTVSPSDISNPADASTFEAAFEEQLLTGPSCLIADKEIDPISSRSSKSIVFYKSKSTVGRSCVPLSVIFN
ncbi:uncharacterized protein TNCV_2125201 [Trichonephila clavipes]|nr:uncharacterized protein TNCV_2125201 [Trichonephila clavipes]